MSIDIHWDDVVLLVSMEGSNGSTTFTDLSTTTKTVNRYGDAQISTTQSKWGNGSGYFDGAGDYLIVTDSDDFTLAGDFTIEMWLYPTTFSGDGDGSNRCPISFASTSFGSSTPAFAFNTNGTVFFYPGSVFLTSTIALTQDAWNHFSFTRSGTTVSFWVDGQAAGSNTFTSTIDPAQVLIGRSINTTGSYQGYIQDLRITKGVARYTETFTPPIESFPTGAIELGSISGTVYERNGSGVYVPGAYPVRLYNRADGSLVASTTSATDGSYAFSNIPITDLAYDPIEYYAVALDTAATWQTPGLAEQVFPT